MVIAGTCCGSGPGRGEEELEMPNIVVCYKWVIDEADVRVESGGSLNLERAARKISEYDRNGIEATAQLHEQHGGDCVAVSLGGPGVQNSTKEALARGPERAVLAIDPAFENADTRITAHGLAAAIRQAGPFDLILCGEGSGNQYNQQVGPASRRCWISPASPS